MKQDDDTCDTSCPSDQYIEGVHPNNNCLDCDSTCLTCSGGLATECLTCDAGRFLKSGECVTDCGDGFFPDNMDNTCKTCHIRCAKCDGPDYTDCDECVLTPEADRYHYDPPNRSCLTEDECKAISFPVGKIRKVDENPDYHCIEVDCDPTCRSCNETTSTHCLTCSGGRWLLHT